MSCGTDASGKYIQVGSISNPCTHASGKYIQVGSIYNPIYIYRYIQSSNQMNFLVEIKFNVSESIIHLKFLTD